MIVSLVLAVCNKNIRRFEDGELYGTNYVVNLKNDLTLHASKMYPHLHAQNSDQDRS